jgi:hypothetical protein
LPDSNAPKLDQVQAELVLQSEGVSDALRSNYAAVLDTFGMYVDHHGFVSGDTRRGVLDWATAPSYLDERLARILRCLQLSRLKGYSSSSAGSVESGDFSYDDGFRKGIETLIGRYRRAPVMPIDWVKLGGSRAVQFLYCGRIPSASPSPTPNEQRVLADAILLGVQVASVVTLLSSDDVWMWETARQEFEQYADKFALGARLSDDASAGHISHQIAAELLLTCGEGIRLAEGAIAGPLDDTTRRRASILHQRLQMQYRAAREAAVKIQAGR